MPKRAKRGAGRRQAEPPDNPAALHLGRIANLLALIATRDMDRREQVRTLIGSGFTQSDAADLLHITPSAVRGFMFRARSRRG